ncbi:MAG TPA: Asd/ArgC dimerization domain-containing protein, partial [Phycisphaerales bacterium]|nr:Asd/ArgC dimerization domain-containing protein [Phycisphaerales bacterium]
GCSLAIFAADAATAREFCPLAVRAGAFVVDNSSAFRMDPDVPLIVPEVNGAAWRRGGPGRAPSEPGRPAANSRAHGSGDAMARPGAPGRLVANPNCTTIILLVAIEPLRRAFGIEAIDVATYQAVSGAGLAGMEELLEQTRSCLTPHGAPGGGPRVFAEPCAFNVFSHDSAVDPASGVNGEERKVIDETRKIWADPAVRVTPTCVRVPVLRAHTEAITVTLRRPASEAEVREALSSGQGLEIIDDRAANRFPTPRKAGERDPVLVGRIRPDPGEPPEAGGRSRRWCLLACADQLRKGAALNAVQIAEFAGALQGGERGMTGDEAPDAGALRASFGLHPCSSSTPSPHTPASSAPS